MAYDPAKDGAQMSFQGRMSYGDYLGLDQILTAQHPLSDAHDEMLFIIQHQTSELWLKLALHEMSAARDHIAAGDLQPAFKMLTRVARIMEQLNSAWDVLRTMTPSEYTDFRESLGESSGFQSYQYRMIEFVAGNRNMAMLRPHAHREELADPLRAEVTRPSLYDTVTGRLRAAGFDVPARAKLDEPHRPDPKARAAWAEAYRDPRKYWELYELAEKLVDFEDYFRRWRFNHVTTVERIIGFKRGSGGTSGVNYLRKMLDVVLFPDLWELRTDL
ncbi:tryptophan 2,3-dioxygenase [Paracoccus fistulariae]|uniref:Tryptophan 2,3-dioxygenase n=1 Tax=Paracoccus fistulariae TaxID=658446 RepID=A0ABY7SJ41_9RHOB|nr:tryptophan 2,3-dioxygenase [Paracoccus fistulariae]MDB6180771.1 tryptophan 2,3-dioxygenase [Paracoccus fistulariae]WCR07007.1 tryptophan 2,3-dioxygenase [Paracoccus fistulariae]